MELVNRKRLLHTIRAYCIFRRCSIRFFPLLYTMTVFIYNSLRLSYLWKGPFPTGETTVSPKGNKNFPKWELEFPLGGTSVSLVETSVSPHGNGSNRRCDGPAGCCAKEYGRYPCRIKAKRRKISSLQIPGRDSSSLYFSECYRVGVLSVSYNSFSVFFCRSFS